MAQFTLHGPTLESGSCAGVWSIWKLSPTCPPPSFSLPRQDLAS